MDGNGRQWKGFAMKKGTWLKGIAVLLLAFGLFWILWGAEFVTQRLPFWQKKELVLEEAAEKTASPLGLSLADADVSVSSSVLKVRIKNRTEEDCIIDRRFLLNVKLENRWYRVPLRELTEQEKRDAQEETEVSNGRDREPGEEGGLAETNSVKGMDFFVTVPAKGELTVDFPIGETYRPLKKGDYRLGVRQKGEDRYTMLEFSVK